MRSVNKLEVALVLDNTGSMASTLGSGHQEDRRPDRRLQVAGRHAGRRRGAAPARPTRSRSAVVPFSMTVNVGSTYSGDELDHRNPADGTGYGTDVFATQPEPLHPADQPGPDLGRLRRKPSRPMTSPTMRPSTSTPASMFVPFFAPDEPDDNTIKSGPTRRAISDDRTGTVRSSTTGCRTTSTPNGTSTLGHASRRTAKYAASNKSNVTSAAKTGTDYGPNAGCGITSLMRLTNVRTTAGATTVKTKLGQMVATGNTNVAMGLAWGWHMVSPNAPFADGVGPTTTAARRQQGHRAADRRRQRHGRPSNPNNSAYSGYGYIAQGGLKNASGTWPSTWELHGDQRRDAIDSREKDWSAPTPRPRACIIYAIGVGVSSHSKTILQACATKLTCTTTSPTPPSWPRCSTPSPARSRTCGSRNRKSPGAMLPCGRGSPPAKF
jgi:hypothetical protein